MQDKTEKASPYKLQKAKDKGQIAKSQALLSSMILITALLVLALKSVTPFAITFQQLITQAPHIIWTESHLLHLLHHVFTMSFYWAMPILLMPFIVLVITGLIQTQGVFAPIVIKPNGSRINPVAGFKRLFSMKTVFDTGIIILKLTGAVALIWLILRHYQHTLLSLNMSTQAHHAFFSLCFNTCLALTLYGLCLAIIDILFSKHQFLKQQKMTKHEVKEEHKQREGDPKIKAKIKQIQWQLRQKTKALANIKHADVLITNPTHIAIALQYSQHNMPAPKLTCKGQGTMAKLMRHLAKRHNIPIVEDKVLARTLFANTELNTYIDKLWYPMVATIFREVLR